MQNISVLLITYVRTEIALRTIRALKKNLIYPENKIHYHIADDGSPNGHIDALHSEIPYASITNAQRSGVGHSMNLGMVECLHHSDFILWMEDDWELTQPFDVEEYLKLFEERPDIGMIRLGYISPGIKGELISASNKLWWKLDKGPQYAFTGHAALRTKAFCQAYGLYKIGLTPGQTELYMCASFNYNEGPGIVIPAWTGMYGIFAHIGAESLKDIKPG